MSIRACFLATMIVAAFPFLDFTRTKQISKSALLILLAAKNEAFIQSTFPRIAREKGSKRHIPIEAALLAKASFSTARRIISIPCSSGFATVNQISCE